MPMRIGQRVATIAQLNPNNLRLRFDPHTLLLAQIPIGAIGTIVELRGGSEARVELIGSGNSYTAYVWVHWNDFYSSFFRDA